MARQTGSEVDDVELPSALERQKLFFLLKRVSSVTAWRRILHYFSAWANATRNSLQVAEEHGWGEKTSLPASENALIFKCLSHCEEGVNRLGKGDKRVFKFDANGEFEMARRILSHWSQMLGRIAIGENIIQPRTPLWPEFCEALRALDEAWGECAADILEPRYLDEPGSTLYGRWLREELARFPEPVARVPDPADSIFVRTNAITPCSGIWEPVDLPPPSLMGLIGLAPKPQAPFKIVGAMNYLHEGSAAPRITVETANDSVDLATSWRLLWRDDRYTDGTIPAEEADYRFTSPAAPTAEHPVFAPTGHVDVGDSGEPVPLGGTWLVETDIVARVVLQQGDTLPRHQGRDVRWVLAERC